jgi:hypothetical protein
MCKQSIKNYLEVELKEHKYDFNLVDFLSKTTLNDDELLQYHKQNPI